MMMQARELIRRVEAAGGTAARGVRAAGPGPGASPRHAPDPGGSPAPRTGRRLLTAMVLVAVCNGLLWVTGVRPAGLRDSVELGVARVEERSTGEVNEGQVRKAIRAQRQTLSFWTTMGLIDDFVIEPLAPAVRATLVAILFSAVAALVGRPSRFADGLAGCVTAQGYWVFGLAVRVALVMVLRSPDVETSLAVLLPAGTYPAPVWAAARQADPFVLWGWGATARGGWRRGQANLATAVLLCLAAALGEAALRVVFDVLAGGVMRVSLLPGRP